MHGLNEIDYGIIAIIGVSVLFGLLRGFVREAMSLMTWVVAGILGALYCDEVGTWFSSISIVGIRVLLAFILIVLVTLIVGGIISHLISKLIKSTKFGITDRIIGVLFGLARGIAIIALIVLIVKPSIVSKKEIWKSAVLVPYFEPVALWIKTKLPEDLLKIYENPPQNSDDIKKTIEKATKAMNNSNDNDNPKKFMESMPENREKNAPEKIQKPSENLKIEEIGSIEDEDAMRDLADNDTAG